MGLENTIRTLPDYWIRFITKTQTRYLMIKLLSLGLFGAFVISTIAFSILHGWSIWIVLWTLWSALLAASVWLAGMPMGKSSFYPMIILLIVGQKRIVGIELAALDPPTKHHIGVDRLGGSDRQPARGHHRHGARAFGRRFIRAAG